MSWLRDIYEFNRLRRELKAMYKNTDILDVFSNTFKIDFHVDRAARMYGIANPQNRIYGYNDNGMSDYVYISRWIADNLLILERYLIELGLAEALKVNITEVLWKGEKTGLYNIVFSPYNFDDYEDSKRKLLKTLGISFGSFLLLSVILLIFI